MNEQNKDISAPIVQYVGHRRITKRNTLWIPPSQMRGWKSVSMTFLADGSIVLGRPFLFPDIRSLRWRDYTDLITPTVLDRNGFPLPDLDLDEDQYEMFDENGLPNVYFADEDEPEPEKESGKENDMKNTQKETGTDLKAVMRSMAESLRGAVESIESCIAMMAAFTESQTP